MTQNAPPSFASNASLLVVMGVFQKLITFTLNQVMVMTTSPDVFGQAAVQLELLLSTLLFLSREGIRLTSLRRKVDCRDDVQEIVNLSWLPPMAVVLFATIIITVRERYFPTYDVTVVVMYCTAAFMECLGEPCYNMYQNAGDIRPRVSAETYALTAKSATTVLCVAYFELGVRGFGAAQILYASIYLIVLLYHLKPATEGKATAVQTILPARTQSGMYVASRMFNTAVTLTGSSLLKHLLTESDKIALTLTASSYNQGIYTVTNNYGSLAARIIFLPLEDSARLAFAKGVSSVKDAADALLLDKEDHKRSKEQDKEGTDRESKEFAQAVQSLKSTLLRLLRLVGFIGLFFALFGIPYIPVAVQFVLGRQWRTPETVSALRMYCLYLLVLGVNGISEAFVQSAAPPSAFATLNTGLLVSSLGFVACAVPAVAHLGTSGIILANVVSMVIRIVNNGRYALRMFAQPHLFVEGKDESAGQWRQRAVDEDGTHHATEDELLPRLVWTITAATSAVIVHGSAYAYAHSAQSLKHAAMHVCVGAVTAVAFLLVSFRYAPKDDVSILTNRFRILNVLRRRKVADKID